MNIKIFFSYFFLLPFFGHAQDTLFYFGGKKEIVYVKEINPTEIRYTMVGFNDSPTVVEKRGVVFKIAFANGQVMELDKTEERRIRKLVNKQYPLDSFYRNNVWLSLAEAFNLRLGLTFEHIFGKRGFFSIRVPFSVSLRDEKVYYCDHRYGIKKYQNSPYFYDMNGDWYLLNLPLVNGNKDLFSVLAAKPNFLNYGNSVLTGIGGRYYVGGQKRRNFFVGVELQGGYFHYYIQTIYNNYYYEEPPKTIGKTGGMIAGFLELGGRFNSKSNRISFVYSLGVGKRYLLGAPNVKSAQTHEKLIWEQLRVISFNPQLQISYNFGK